MPVPAAPRRAAPPRRKAPKSPTPPAAVIEDAPVAESPATGTPQLTSDDGSKELQEAVHKSKEDEESLGLSPVTQPLDSAHEPPRAESAEHAAELAKPTEDSEPAEHTTTPEDVPVQPVQDKLAELALDSENEHGQAERADAPSALDEPVEDDSSPVPEHQQPITEPEEEDEAERRKRIAERLRQQGGFNPFGAPPPSPPVRRPSEHEAPSRKASVDVHHEEAALAVEPDPAVDEPDPVPSVVRRQSTDSTAESLKSPTSPPLPQVLTRPDASTRRDSHMSSSNPYKIDEAEEESLDGK